MLHKNTKHNSPKNINLAVIFSMVNGQWSMVNGQWSMVNGQWSMVNGFINYSFSLIFCTLFSRLSVKHGTWCTINYPKSTIYKTKSTRLIKFFAKNLNFSSMYSTKSKFPRNK
jgi:hypothetical protein